MAANPVVHVSDLFPEYTPDFFLSGLDPDREYHIFPGFCDVHVHFREPGFSYKETIQSGSRSALRGGYTAVCTMPNLNPVPDTPEHLVSQTDSIRRNAAVHIYPYGAISMGRKGQELSDMDGIAGQVIAFSDDGSGVQDDGLMRAAMEKARALNRIIAAHCEVNSLLNGGYIHQGNYAAVHGHAGISSESEWRQIERDLHLAADTGCAYHVCHISCRESAELIRQAKKSGVNVTCETAPHYLTLDENDLQEHGRFKMNPPLRAREDRLALIEAVQDGTVDMIATDHAPHSAEEKCRGLKGSAFGIVGLETAFPVMYTKLVLPGILTLEELLRLMAWAPRKRFGIPIAPRDYAVWDLNAEWTVEPEQFLTLGRATPYEGETLRGVCIRTSADLHREESL